MNSEPAFTPFDRILADQSNAVQPYHGRRENKKQLNIRVSSDLVRKLALAAEQDGLSVAAYCTMVLTRSVRSIA